MTDVSDVDCSLSLLVACFCQFAFIVDCMPACRKSLGFTCHYAVNKLALVMLAAWKSMTLYRPFSSNSLGTDADGLICSLLFMVVVNGCSWLLFMVVGLVHGCCQLLLSLFRFAAC